ncbi:hypothetical protein KC315_g12 [Hortaea werneckii]|nr:hypothetical protein KC315_g12 [Hortaea werneckii]
MATRKRQINNITGPKYRFLAFITNSINRRSLWPERPEECPEAGVWFVDPAPEHAGNGECVALQQRNRGEGGDGVECYGTANSRPD